MHLETFVWGAHTGEAWQVLVLCLPPSPPTILRVHPPSMQIESVGLLKEACASPYGDEMLFVHLH